MAKENDGNAGTETPTMTLEEARQARVQNMGTPVSEEAETEETPEKGAESGSKETGTGKRSESEEKPGKKGESEESEETEEKPESEETEETEESEETEDSEEETEEENEALAQLENIDWDNLDEETSAEIARRVGSGAGKRIGKLNQQVKDLENQVQSKDKALQDGLGKIAAPDNSFGEITDENKLEEAEKTLEKDIDYFERWLEGNDEYFEDANGRTHERKTVANHLRNLRQQAKDIPKQREYLRKIEKAKERSRETDEKIQSEFDWMHDESSSQRKKYDELVSSEDMTLLEKVSPELAANYRYIAAHAADSMAGEKKRIVLSKKKPKPRKNADSAANSSGNRNSESKRNKELEGRAKKGDVSAIRELRAKQIQKQGVR